MFDKFSDQARQVVVLASGAARTQHQNSIGTEHLLVGILDAGGPGAAALTSWGVTKPALDSKLEELSAPTGSAPASGHIPFTPKTKKVLYGALLQKAGLLQDRQQPAMQRPQGRFQLQTGDPRSADRFIETSPDPRPQQSEGRSAPPPQRTRIARAAVGGTCTAKTRPDHPW
ncbi:Clp protease N-terminal domain-containing protein [Rhodococcus opacus]|uniref:Clp protease N-terminal domain-containing protein n=1 Tax=Rhodococcus opacus TaxID=37919 RepID=UPI002948CF15|nr:Clp protease N-terminal domain-containing protein [Rhodococcus opacus]MDV6244765.1 Clp protease N-terminal domain-containing protein [Rhodococcus opacus]